MPTRKALAAIAVCLISSLAVTAAAIDIPAVNLPPGTPDVVRDSVARSLAKSRDTLGWALHPFRGEFHGLGINPYGSSIANDLSGDGRVVVGYDWDSGSGSREFVWSPATGKAYYNMLPRGASGTPFFTPISSDGVYVGRSAKLASSTGAIAWAPKSRGLLWSLAGSQDFSSRYNDNVNVAALSGDGMVAVGAVSDFGSFCYCSGPYTPREIWAYRYTRGGTVEEIDWLMTEGGGRYINSMAVDVTTDGSTVLVNGFDHNIDDRAEPFLWEANGELHPLGQATIKTYQSQIPLVHTLITRGGAISADGSTVVGSAQATIQDYYDTGFNGTWPVLWREQFGWIDLGRLKTTASESFIGGSATHVSGDGSVVVGYGSIKSFDPGSNSSTSNTKRVPFLWDEARGMRELADVLRLDYGLDLSGWTLAEATGISDDGTTIIGNGRNPAGQYEAWRGVLHRNTPLGDIDFDGDVDGIDYQRLTGNLGVTADDGAVFYADGDLNADGRIDELDVIAFQNASPYRSRGDFNADGLVNAADYTIWRDYLTSQTDLAAWRSHLGMVLGGLLPIPEPGSMWLVAMAAGAAMSFRGARG